VVIRYAIIDSAAKPVPIVTVIAAVNTKLNSDVFPVFTNVTVKYLFIFKERRPQFHFFLSLRLQQLANTLFRSIFITQFSLP
jgi:hypothetical protein